MIVVERENMDLFRARIFLKKTGSGSYPDRLVSQFSLQHIFPPYSLLWHEPGAEITFFTLSDDYSAAERNKQDHRNKKLLLPTVQNAIG